MEKQKKTNFIFTFEYKMEADKFLMRCRFLKELFKCDLDLNGDVYEDTHFGNVEIGYSVNIDCEKHVKDTLLDYLEHEGIFYLVSEFDFVY